MEPVTPTQNTPQTPATPIQTPKKRKMLRRSFLLTILAFIIFGSIYFRRKPPRFETKKRVVMLGFDGCDPFLLEKWKDELPNLSLLANMGSQRNLISTVPPESPVAWSSFAVGANPGHHGVYDFLRRPVGTYLPSMESFVEREYAKFLFKEIPIKLPKAKLRRGGIAFWDVLSEKGVATDMLEIPVTFPAPKLSHGHVLSGLGVPDIRGLQATFHKFVFPAAENEETTFGGKIVALDKPDDSDWYKGKIFGPYNPVLDEQKRELEKKRLDQAIKYCEWMAHLHSTWGKHATDDDRYALRVYFAQRVQSAYSYYPYLQTEEFSRRIETLKLHIHTGQKLIMEEGATASDARMNISEAMQEYKKYNEQIPEYVKTVFADVQFRPIDGSTVEIKIDDNVKSAKLNEWSDWFTITFKITRLISIQAVCKFYPQEIQPNQINIFMTSPDIDPRNPAISISHPSSYSKELAEWVGGPFKTRGWAAETHGLKDGHLSEEGFMEDLIFLMTLREAKTFETFERSDSNVFISVFSETDRVAHMFHHCIDEKHPLYTPELAAKYGDCIKKIYIRMDEIVGRMMQKIGDDPDTLLLVMSDHGFSSWRHQVNLNTWLWRNGFMTLKGGISTNFKDTNKKLEDLIGQEASYFSFVDWSNSKAYAMGLGQIYINLQGREPLGIVAPDQYDEVCDSICERLMELRDDREGMDNAPIFSYVKKRCDIWKGPLANDNFDCPDIMVGFNRGYRVSWQTCLGGIEDEIIAPNLEKWSGDHCSLATEQVPGMFFSNRKEIAAGDVSIYDFAPTILRYFGFEPPEAMEGKDLLS